MGRRIAGILFDVYGTLLDVYAVEQKLEALFPAKGKALSVRWRDKQIEYSRLRTLSGAYTDFWTLTGDALDYVCELEKVALTVAARAELMAVYEHLPAHREVPAALAALHARGLTLGVLTNGNETMARKALDAAELLPLMSHVLSVERVRKFKTAPEAYQLGPDALKAPAGEIVFVSSNAWDAVGAAGFGYRAFWINRAGAPRERLWAEPEGEGRTMADLAGFLEA